MLKKTKMFAILKMTAKGVKTNLTENEYLNCATCTNSFSKEDEIKENKLSIWSTDCYHLTHKDCFIAYVFKLAKKGQPITCPK